MKNLLALIVCALLAFTLASCADNNNPPVDNGGQNGTTEHIHYFTEWEMTLRPTCTENGEKVRYCACGESQTASVLSNGHTEVIDQAVPATCTKTGLAEGKHCSECGEVLVKQEIIPALGHTEVVDYGYDATCTENGLTEGKHCSVCSKILAAQEIIPAGHVLANGKCKNCDYTYNSLGLKFTPNGDGTCYVSGIGTCSDTEVVIPETSPDGHRVTAIGELAFSDCDSLTSIVIPSSVASIGDNAFSSCDSLTSVTFAEGSQLTSVGCFAFHGCDSLTSIEIPASVTSVGSYAFLSCTSLSEIMVADGNTNYKDIDGNLYSYDGTELIQYAVGKTDYTFAIPTSVTSIGDGAFYKCNSLTSIEIPAGVTSIGDDAFYYCISLTSIEIPASVTSIGDYAFSGCTSLTSIVIPSGVTSIGDSAFRYCTSLTSIVIPAGVTSIGDKAFSYCSKLTDVYYTGTEAQWAKISIGSNNSYLTNATIHYNDIPEK